MKKLALLDQWMCKNTWRYWMCKKIIRHAKKSSPPYPPLSNDHFLSLIELLAQISYFALLIIYLMGYLNVGIFLKCFKVVEKNCYNLCRSRWSIELFEVRQESCSFSLTWPCVVRVKRMLTVFLFVRTYICGNADIVDQVSINAYQGS